MFKDDSIAVNGSVMNKPVPSVFHDQIAAVVIKQVRIRRKETNCNDRKFVSERNDYALEATKSALLHSFLSIGSPSLVRF